MSERPPRSRKGIPIVSHFLTERERLDRVLPGIRNPASVDRRSRIRRGAAIAVAAASLVSAFASTARASTSTTIGLSGGAPVLAAGQQIIQTAGVSYVSWTSQQEDASGFGVATQALIPTLALRTHLRTNTTMPSFTAGLYQTQDEAWWGGYDPAITAAQVDAIHAAGGRAVTNQGWNPWNPPTKTALAAYGVNSDVLSVDMYPTARYPNADVGPHVALMKSISHGRPVWASIQVCSKSNMTTGIVPGPAREWKMAKAALDNGATGITFFGASYSQCFHSIRDRATGFNWSAWYATVLPTIHKIRAYAR